MVRVIYNGLLLVAFVVAYLVCDIFVATIVVMAGVTVEVVTTLLVRHRATRVQWIGLATVLVLGGATLLFRDPTWIKWRPSGFYWLCASALLGSRFGLGTNALQATLGRWVSMPDAVWARLLWIWIGFLVFLGIANLFVAYRFSTGTWVMYRLFGAPGMILVLAAGLAIWLRGYLRQGWRDHKANRSDRNVRSEDPAR